MKVVEYQKLLGVMYREDYQNDPLIAKTLIESGWAVKRLLENKTISPFDEYEKVQELIMNETKWRQPDGAYRRT
ncbi:hypothetical protein PZL24_05485 [Staphylococcus epidermidis]|jgi:hypothetical protein|uniref:Uncharacterized protein n=4 Tax=root TaxID=1 RepID=A1BUA1_9CAUD|nr:MULTISPECIES: hypothetical protein [Staphylococcus]YP_006561205.1 hypothetical protein B624_gp43 [Staphylococcus phage Ipla7]YP_009302070.1 hypothetical protein BJD82_gp52 [Staphylococcus phage CNPx]YP_950714.1 hypothetical protein ph52 [Staphylococcus phage PH15]EAF9399139.1 hypothetical protein [Listeria monocytogenes]WNM54526.1 hypothetical protein CoNPh18_CDS0064 [Staphylococcus phage S-CoN_Ph18]WNM54596.1 hypothetical protein CoNPh19_CDS0049 [Staphylococcus phage S-CoN_Ph19]WNM54681.